MNIFFYHLTKSSQLKTSVPLGFRDDAVWNPSRSEKNNKVLINKLFSTRNPQRKEKTFPRLFTVNISLSKRKSTEWNIWELWLSQGTFSSTLFFSSLLRRQYWKIQREAGRIYSHRTFPLLWERLASNGNASRAAHSFTDFSVKISNDRNLVWRKESICCILSTRCSQRDHSWRATRRRESPGLKFSTQHSGCRQALWGQQFRRYNLHSTDLYISTIS